MVDIDEALHNMVVSGHFGDIEEISYFDRFSRVRGQLLSKLEKLPDDLSCGEVLAGFGVDQEFKIGWDGKDHALSPRVARFLAQLPIDALLSEVKMALQEAAPVYG